jgi:hypothetical protein
LTGAEDNDAPLDDAAFGGCTVAAATGASGVCTTGAATPDAVLSGPGVFICGLDAVAGKAWDGATGRVGTTIVCCAAPIRAARAKAIMKTSQISPSGIYALATVVFQLRRPRSARPLHASKWYSAILFQRFASKIQAKTCKKGRKSHRLNEDSRRIKAFALLVAS